MRTTWIAALVAVVAVVLAGCSDDEPTAVDTATPITTTPVTESPTPTRTPRPDSDGDGIPDVSDDFPDDPERWQAAEVRLECYLDDSVDTEETFTVVEVDFSEVWPATPYSCDATRSSAQPNDVEQDAFEASGYDNRDSITTLYEMCAEVDPEDTYASGEHTASEEQILEITGMLTLCPDHPLADEISATAERGRVDIELEEAGLLIFGGTHLVEEEIQPGTYVIEGEIENCYWERQDSAGNIIDNNFILSARRVEVMIRASDYAFHTEGCGRWRPAD